ncbi:MAG TPA: sigma-70 family RNA polymerase sigma factor [Phycisphaerae bacterium]|nr:sigma-70 family RNA polymerase sigma factor [Phycisphaerae bacterium]HRY71221.1 sigma-70 family RNA polymerase sigma factor [Phycisphaerae bacterium]HSA29576.1 sigma-70 family RNA polymerase sigma factor [Phycisphaerae bacterium]
MESADRIVLDHAVRGDREALMELLNRHGPAIRLALKGRIPRRWQAVLSDDDVMQQTYADAIFKIAQFSGEDEGRFEAWLRSIARRNLKDAIKGLERKKREGDRRRVERVGGALSYAELVQVLTGSQAGPSTLVRNAEAIQALERAVEQLPEDYRRVVTLYDLQECPVGQVAREMGRSEGAVFMLRSRAHDRLHQILGSTSRFFSTSS